MTTTLIRSISNYDDTIDSRDVIERIEELEAEREALADEAQEADDRANDLSPDEQEAEWRAACQEADAAHAAIAEWDESGDADELRGLRALAENAEPYADDWSHGATLIRRSYFVEYCKQLVSDIGDLPNDIPAYLVIDWDATADNLEADYTTVDFDGEEYLVR